MDALFSPPVSSKLDQKHEEDVGPTKTKRIVKEQAEDDQDELPDEEDYMKVRLYFYNSEKEIRSKLFTEEWFVVAQEHLDDADELQKSGIPFVEVSNSQGNSNQS